MSNWTIEEVGNIDLGDQRLNKRVVKILGSASNSSEGSIPRACKTWGETLAAYRFFNNKKVSDDKILNGHINNSIERIKKERIVLIPQDTTEIKYTGRKIEDMGYLSSENSKGIFAHTSIAITEDKLCLGVVDKQVINREEIGIRKSSKSRAIEEKESYRWIKGYEVANKIAHLASETTIVSISDREGDIYEMLEKIPSEENKAFWIVRSSINRRAKDENKLKDKIWCKVRKSEVIGKIEFMLPEGKIYQGKFSDERLLRKKRLIIQEVRACKVLLSPPPRKNKKCAPVAINIVHCVEVNPPSEDEKIEWFLLTSMPISNRSLVFKIVDYYLCRWQIEIFFKILKSGCNIEKLQFTTLKAICNCITLYMIIAWRILYITMISRIYPDTDSGIVFESYEWKAIYIFVKNKNPPQKTPSLKEIILMIATLGGFLNRRSDKNPGTKVIWQGMQRARDLAMMYTTANNLQKQNCV
jgi:hypothetical protein